MRNKNSQHHVQRSSEKNHHIKKSIESIPAYLFEEVKEKHYHIFIYYFAAVSLLEILAYACKGVFSILASRVWLIGGLVCLITILVNFYLSIRQDFIDKKYFSILAVFALIFFLFLFVGDVNISEINPDATQQAAAGLNSFHSYDLNYTGKAFLGYPNRQYILSALPAFLFGRSIKTLHMGFVFPFILGIMLIYCSLRKWAQKMNINTSAAILPLYALFVFPFVTEYYINFEQAIYPISFTMITIGFFMYLLCELNAINLFCVAWIGCLLGNSYTPALATLGLLIVLLLLLSYSSLKKPNVLPFSVKAPQIGGKLYILAAVNVLLFFIASFIDKREDRITKIRESIGLHSVFQSIIDFLTDQHANFLGMFGIIVLVYIFASLTFRFKTRDFLLSLWTIGVFIATNLLMGYTTYQPAWIMQRALVVIPVLIIAMTLTAWEFILKYKIEIKQWLIWIIIFTFALIGFHNFRQINQSFTYFNHIQPMKYMIKDFEDTVHENDLTDRSEFNFILYTENILIKNPADYFAFFYPEANVYTPDYGVIPEDIDLSLPTFFYSDKEVPELSESSVMYDDKRHNMSIIWYKGIAMPE